MNEFATVLDVSYDALIISGEYGGVNDLDGRSMEAPARNRIVALIRDMLGGETAIIRQNARDAGTAVSTIQIFSDAIGTIAEKLIKMLEMTKKALVPDDSEGQIEDLQTHLQILAEEINQTANGTEYNFNKPFAENGKTFSIPIGNGSKIDIFAKDFRLDAQDINIAADPQNTLTVISKAITNINEYKSYLDRQEARLGETMAAIELEIQSFMGVDIKDFQAELAAPMADNTAILISRDKQTSLNTQANLTPDEILKLLKVN